MTIQEEFTDMVRKIGAGYHPDISGDQYTGLPEGMTAEFVDDMNSRAIAADLNVYAIALDIIADPMDKWIDYVEGLSYPELLDIINGKTRPGNSNEENILIWNLAIDVERDMR